MLPIFGGMPAQVRLSKRLSFHEETRRNRGCVAVGIGQARCRNSEHGSHHMVTSHLVLLS